MAQTFCSVQGVKRKWRVLRPGSLIAVPVTTAPMIPVWQGTPDTPIPGGTYAETINGNKWVDSTLYDWLIVLYQGFGIPILIREQDYSGISGILPAGANWAAPWILHPFGVDIRPQA